MHQPAAPVMQAAIEPAFWFILFVIVVNLLSPLLRRRRMATSASQSQSSPSNTSDAQATMAAERERIRQALATALQQRRTQASPASAPQPAPASVTPIVVPAPIRLPTPPADVPGAALTELPPMLSADGMQLMTLEASMQAPGTRPAARARGMPQLVILRGPRGIADAFVAAAIVGPCAAVRRLGHTPAGW